MSKRFRNQSKLRRYALAVAATLIGIALQIGLNPFLGNLRFLIVWPVGFSVMALAGFGPACVSILLSALTAEFYFTPMMTGGEVALVDHIKTLIFVVSSLGVAWLLNRNQQAETHNIERLAQLEERERRRVERELKRSEDEMLAVFEKAPVGMVQAEYSSGKFLRVNRQYSEITGYSQSELLNMGALDLTHPEDVEEGREQIAKLRAGEIDLYDYEKRYVRKDQSVIWVRARASVIRDSKGAPLSILAVVQDVDDRKRAEQRIHESEERYRQLTETLPQLIWTALPNGGCDYLSRQWIEYTGVPEAEQLGYGWLEQVHPDDRVHASEHWRGAVAGLNPLDSEMRLRRSDGVYRWFKSRGTPVYDREGKIIYWFGTSTDIHEQRLAVDLVQRANQDLKSAKEQAEQANRLKSTFLANMSHEIRTPMTAVLGFAELLRDGDLPDAERVDAVERIVRGGQTLLKLIDDILDISKIEADQILIARARFQPEELVNEVLSLVRLQAAEKNIEIILEMDRSVPAQATSDAGRLRQILINLLGNAVKFTQKGSVRLRVSAVRSRALFFEVRDTGIGIPLEDQSRLFQPFAQGDASVTRQFGGSGLGLALSKRLCKELGGDLVLVSSSPGQGSCFVASIDAHPFQGGEAPSVVS